MNIQVLQFKNEITTKMDNSDPDAYDLFLEKAEVFRIELENLLLALEMKQERCCTDLMLSDIEDLKKSIEKKYPKQYIDINIDHYFTSAEGVFSKIKLHGYEI